jgi:site-specific DNA-methyltransferase (adenine-specific)
MFSMILDTLYSGDCLDWLKTIDSGSIDLVYLDPPFFTQKVQISKTRDNTQEYRFADTWTNIEAYKAFLRLRIEQCKRVLKTTGSIFVHCDSSASHHIRLLLDELFGPENFQSEIIWIYKRWSNARRGLLNAHQTIYFYSKSNTFKFNVIHTDYSPTTNLDQILQQRERDKHGKSAYKKDDQGRAILGKEKCGVPLSNVWEIPYLNPKAGERTGYPTQKPVLLLEKIIEIATDKDDVVLDPMCGSGTSLVAAALLERHWIGIDSEPKVIELAKARLDKPHKTISRLLEVGKEAYRKQNIKTRSLLEMMNALVVERNNGLDGFLKVHYLDAPVAIRIQKENESLEESRRQLLKASVTKGCILNILIRTHPAEYQQQTVHENPEVIDSNVLIIDSYELLIQEWLREKQEQTALL